MNVNEIFFREKSKTKKLSTPYDVSVTHIMTYQVGVELIVSLGV